MTTTTRRQRWTRTFSLALPPSQVPFSRTSPSHLLPRTPSLAHPPSQVPVSHSAIHPSKSLPRTCLVLASSHLLSHQVTFAKDVHAECEASHDFTLINDKVAVGDLGAAESRLMLNLHGVRSILYAATHEMASLWKEDGIRYRKTTLKPRSRSGLPMVADTPPGRANALLTAPRLELAFCSPS